MYVEKSLLEIFLLIEPIGSAKPKFATISETLGTYRVVEDEAFALTCPAQSFPVPAFRWVVSSSDRFPP